MLLLRFGKKFWQRVHRGYNFKHILNIVKGLYVGTQTKSLIVDFKINSELNTVPHISLVFILRCKNCQGTQL